MADLGDERACSGELSPSLVTVGGVASLDGGTGRTESVVVVEAVRLVIP